MKSLKYVVMALLLTLLPAIAQPPQGGNLLDRLRTELNLTDQQVAQLQPLFAEQQSRRDALRSQIDSVLTDQQRAQMQSGGGGRPQPGQRPFANLGLSADQQARIDQILASAQNDRASFEARLNSILTPEQQARFAQMRQQHGPPGRG